MLHESAEPVLGGVWEVEIGIQSYHAQEWTSMVAGESAKNKDREGGLTSS